MASCLTTRPLNIPLLRPIPIKRFVGEDEREKPQVVVKEEATSKRKCYFTITKNNAVKDEVKDKKALRAEKNRLFAKESKRI